MKDLWKIGVHLYKLVQGKICQCISTFSRMKGLDKNKFGPQVKDLYPPYRLPEFGLQEWLPWLPSYDKLSANHVIIVHLLLLSKCEKDGFILPSSFLKVIL